MTEPATTEVTGLLRAWRGGDPLALDRLMPLIYEELKRLARRSLRNQAQGNTLQATALVNEAYLKLVDIHSVDWQDRLHFFAVSAQIMRWILVDRARKRAALRRGAGHKRSEHSTAINLDEVPDAASERAEEILAVDEALAELAKFDARKARVVELRFFGGLSVEETAEILNVSPQSVMRDWKLAKAWLLRTLGGNEGAA